MIYIAVAIFLLPIFLKLLQQKNITIKIILPTLICYSIWYLLSIFFILLRINISTYLYIFYFFPAILLGYEIYITFKIRKILKINKYFIYFAIFVIVNLIINLFTYKHASGDTSAYLKWTIDAYNSNSYIKSSMYKYNSFYYISLIFGKYYMYEFFSVLNSFILGSITFICLLTVLNMLYKKTQNFVFVIIISIILSLWLNTYVAISINFSMGPLIAIGFLLIWTIFKRNNNMTISEFIFFDMLIIFSLNFGITGFVVSVAMIVILKVMTFIKLRKFGYLGTVFMYSLFLYLFLSENLSHQIMNIIIYTTFVLMSAVSICFAWRQTALAKQKSIKFNGLINFWKTDYIKNGRFYKYLILNMVIASYMFVTIMLLQNYTTRGRSFWFMINLVILLSILVNLCLILEFYSLLILIISFISAFSLYTVLQKTILSSILVTYLPDRVSYAINIISIVFIVILFMLKFLYMPSDSKFFIVKKIFLCVFPVLLLSISLDGTGGALQAKFRLSMHNNNIDKPTYNLLYKNMHDIDKQPVFSEIDNPLYFQTDYSYYNNGLLYKPGQRQKLGFLGWFKWGSSSQNEFEKKIDNLYYQVENTIFFKIIILLNNSNLNHNSNINNNYKILDYNDSITIWARL